MPHSGGGGSFGGGFHSGSSSSYGSSNINHLDNQRTSTSYFPGAYTFLYYSHGRPCYKYANYDLNKQERESKLGGFAVCLIAAVICGIIGFLTITGNINKTEYKVENTNYLNVLIKDNDNLLDVDKLSSSFKEIKDDTGAIFSIVTTTTDKWNNDYDNLEDYSYNYYLESFGDEYHYLIVYSIADNDKTNWAFETMVGDNYSDYIDSDTENEFSSNLYNDLKNGEDLTTAIIENCEELSLKMVDGAKSNSKFNLIFGIIMSVIGLIAFIFAIISFVHFKQDPELVQIDDKEKEVGMNCPYCGQRLLTTKFTRCPFCKNKLD